jgi:hypothetical protein
VSVAPALFEIAPPFPAELLENVEFLTVSVPLFRIPPPSPVVAPNSIWSPSIVTFDAASTDSNLTVFLPLRVGMPLCASNVRLGPANVTVRAVGVGEASW